MIDDQLFEYLDGICEDHTVPRNIKSKIGHVLEILKSKEEDGIKLNKALNILDEISDDDNIQPYTRTQIWNIVSMLESVN